MSRANGKARRGRPMCALAAGHLVPSACEERFAAIETQLADQSTQLERLNRTADQIHELVKLFGGGGK